jgi:predicted O-methyltransferase YrrM
LKLFRSEIQIDLARGEIMTDALINDQVKVYLQDLVPPRPPEMEVMESYAAEHHFPIIGPAAGYLCYQIARMTGAHQVFEMGSGYGYSTAWLAQAVKENGGGVVHHVVWDEDLSQKARKHLSALGLNGLIKYHVAEAVETLKTMQTSFDLIFNDINKEGYPASLEVIKQKLRPGGVLLVDNMLWSGRIFDDADTTSATQGIRKFTKLIHNDPDWITTLIPIRDGVMVAFRK